MLHSRGSPAISNLPTSDVHSGSGDSHRTSTGLNGPNNLSERTAYSPRVDLAYVIDRFSDPATFVQLNAPERNINKCNRDGRNADRNLDRPVAISPPAQLQGTLVSQNASSDSEAFPERLQGLSLSAIREYYRYCFFSYFYPLSYSFCGCLNKYLTVSSLGTILY